MTWSNRLRKRRLVAIKNFDDELYRMVKVYASLEGRTISSIFEEAIRLWVGSRKDYEETRIWADLEEAYEKNMKVLKEAASSLKDSKGFIVVCDGNLIGVFQTYEEAIKNSKTRCKTHSLITELPFKEKERVIELGLPW